MAKIIRDPATAVANWQGATATKAPFYASQVAAATWKQYASAPQAEANYAQAMQAAIAAKSRLNGVNASSDSAWQAGVQQVGQARWADGIAKSTNRMTAAMTKVIGAEKQIIATLPPSGPRGSQQNITRSTTFMTSMAKLRGTLGAKGVPRG